MRIRYMYTMRTRVSSINLNAQDITGVSSSPTGYVVTCIVNGLCNIKHQYTDIDDTNPSASAHFSLSAGVFSDYV